MLSATLVATEPHHDEPEHHSCFMFPSGCHLLGECDPSLVCSVRGSCYGSSDQQYMAVNICMVIEGSETMVKVPVRQFPGMMQIQHHFTDIPEGPYPAYPLLKKAGHRLLPRQRGHYAEKLARSVYEQLCCRARVQRKLAPAHHQL